MAALLDRARQLLAGGPHVTQVSELIAVHALIYPTRDPVCDHCPAEQGKAYYAIKRWVTQQENSSTIFPDNVKHNSTARFHSDELIYTPHGLGVAYSNANLTDKAARDILKADPDAKQHFAVLPPDAPAGEQEQPAAEPAPAAQAAAPAQPAAPAPMPANFDYRLLASAMIDELERRQAKEESQQESQGADQHEADADTDAKDQAAPEEHTDTLPNGTEVTTGHTDGASEDDHHDEKPVRLSRMGKDQLLTTYRTELRMEPADGLTNDQLRDAIAEHRAGQADAD